MIGQSVGKTNVQKLLSDPETFRCSSGQQSLWLIDQIASGNPAYNLHAALRTPFALMPELLAVAASALVERHETLRTQFDWDGYEPVQRVLEESPSCLLRADLQGMTQKQAEAELVRLSAEDAATPFDLGRAPLLRLGLVQMPRGKSVLLVTIHHIIADAWSMNILVRDLLELYVAAANNRPAQLPSLPIQYVDFAAWQRASVDEERHAELIEGWRSYLTGTAELDLPTDHPRGLGGALRGDHHRFELPRDLSETCLQSCRDFAATPYVLITGCFAEVLNRYGGSDDFMIGMPTAGRSRPDLENLIGFFVRTLVLRIDLTGQPTFRTLVGRIRTSISKAMALQDLPFERVVEMIDPDRDIALNPLFQVTSQYFSNPFERTDSSSIDVVDLHRGFANFDLTLDFWEENGVIVGRIEYASDLYDRGTITRLIGHLTTLLQAALSEPDRPLAELEMLTRQERQQVLDTWSKGAQNFPKDATLSTLFAEVCALYPDRAALCDDAGHMTYAQFENEVFVLAAHLAEQGVETGDYVGLCMPRGRAQIVSALAIVMAGAAYVALDADWPTDRIEEIISITGLSCVIVEEDVDILRGTDVRTITYADLPAKPAKRRCVKSGDAIAYAAFTSGSTGTPKGVPTTHRAVVRLMRGGAPFEFSSDDIMLAFAPLGFDASTFEIWGPLLNGACIAIAPEGPLSAEELADFMGRAGVNKAWLTAGLFSQICAARPATIAGLRAAFAGGDVLAEPAVRRILQGGGTVINGYGPTENTVFTCHSFMQGEAAIDDGIRIGRPVSGTYVYILDHNDRPVPSGIPGELIAGGAGLSPGYLGGPGTAASFSIDPIDPSRGRVFRTGDRVRWTENGEIAFLGRSDRQVKIRGFRIDLGEVEKAILSLSSAQACAVAVRGTQADDKALVAFVVFGEDGGDVAGLRQVLAKGLPVQSRPSSIVAIAKMPLGDNGKINVAALLEMPVIHDDVGFSSETMTEIEDLVAETFASVLGCESVPVDQPFFDLGGHSLHATRVVSRLREELEIEMPLRAIFEFPTVRGLSACLEHILLGEFDQADEVAE